MTTDKVMIDRELLERLACEVIPKTHQEMLDASEDFGAAIKELRAILAAPRQPEGEGLEVVAWQDAENPLYTTGEKRQMHGWATDGYPVVELCRLSDAQRAIAELLEVNRIQLEIATVHGAACAGIRKQRDKLMAENERLQMQLAACGVIALANTPESACEARKMHPDYMSASCHDVANAVDREMKLRTQLAEIESALVAKNHEAHDLEIDNRQLRKQLDEARELLSRLEDYRIKWLKPTKVELEVVAWLEANK